MISCKIEEKDKLFNQVNKVEGKLYSSIAKLDDWITYYQVFAALTVGILLACQKSFGNEDNNDYFGLAIAIVPLIATAFSDVAKRLRNKCMQFITYCTESKRLLLDP